VPDKIYRLGRECELEIDGEPCTGVADVTLRESTEMVDATGMGHVVQSEVAVIRTFEVSVTFREMTKARELWARRVTATGGFILPTVFTLRLSGGLVEVYESFTLGEMEADESIDGLVVPRFVFKQWGHT
jgi:hypothetical protein